MIELTDDAITQLLRKQAQEGWKNIRLGITGGGCAGFEYIFDSVNHDGDSNDVFLDHGKFGIVIDKMSIPSLLTYHDRWCNISSYNDTSFYWHISIYVDHA